MSLSRAFALLAAFGLVGLAAPTASSQSPPNLLQFQARVADASGTPLAGPVTVEVKIYDVPSGGIPLWSEIHSATALNGVVNLPLGSISVPPLTLFDGTARYLAVRVGADAEMTPRRQIAAIPFARRAAGVAALDATTSIPVGLVTSAHILDGTIATADLANGAVDASKLGANAVTSSSILDGTIASADLANGTVTNAKLAAGAVTLASLAANSVDGTKIIDGSIAAAELAAGAVTSASILDGTITAADLANGVIDASKLAANAVTSAAILDGTIATADLANGAVTGTKLATNAVNSAAILDGSITAFDLGMDSVTSLALAPGAVGPSKIAIGAVDSAKILDGSITLADLATPLTTASTFPAMSLQGSGVGMSPGVLFVAATATSGTNFGVTSQIASSGAGVLAWNTSTTGAADGVRAFINSDAGYAVWAEANSTNGGRGVVASSYGIGGIGVYGSTYAGTGASYGVVGYSESTSGRGVSGTSNAPTGVTSGVAGVANSPDGTGVTGWCNAATGAPNGVVGITYAPSGRGVSGISNASGATYGVMGSTWGTSGSRAVYGQANNTTGVADALVGAVSSPAGYAVWSLGPLVCTGTKNFAQPHPTNPGQEIHFACLEGNESGTYFRGTGKLVDGRFVIDVPADFRLASESEGLTVQLTPAGADARLWTESEDLEHIVVRGSVDAKFHYLVNGVRRGYADYATFHANRSFVPEVRGVPFGTQYSEAVRRILVENGTLNADFTPNEETASKLGWTLRDPEEVKAEQQRFAVPPATDTPASRDGK